MIAPTGNSSVYASVGAITDRPPFTNSIPHSEFRIPNHFCSTIMPFTGMSNVPETTLPVSTSV